MNFAYRKYEVLPTPGQAHFRGVGGQEVTVTAVSQRQSTTLPDAEVEELQKPIQAGDEPR
jgi:hypothetical protein